MYAIVRSGGRQHKVVVGDVIDVNRVGGAVGESLDLPAVLVVDGETVTHAADALAKVRVTAEVVEHRKGPKIRIHLYRNKTGYHRRQGHRQPLSRLRVTGIDSGK